MVWRAVSGLGVARVRFGAGRGTGARRRRVAGSLEDEGMCCGAERMPRHWGLAPRVLVQSSEAGSARERNPTCLCRPRGLQASPRRPLPT